MRTSSPEQAAAPKQTRSRRHDDAAADTRLEQVIVETVETRPKYAAVDLGQTRSKEQAAVPSESQSVETRVALQDQMMSKDGQAVATKTRFDQKAVAERPSHSGVAAPVLDARLQPAGHMSGIFLHRTSCSGPIGRLRDRREDS